MRRRAVAGALALVALSTLALAGGTGSAAEPAAARSVATGRVLVVSLPAVVWSDLQRVDAPNLRRLFAESAVGSLATNGVVAPSPLGESYLTLGAGTRAVGERLVVGEGFGVDEDFGGETAGPAFTTRTGVPAGTGLVYMPIVSITEANESESYGAEVGLFGDTLARAGITRGVVTNGDGSDPSTPERLYPPYRRAAVGALTTSTGKVPSGKVDRNLLMDDPTAPFGVRLDPDAVVDAFADAWQPKSVVLVEGSDLVRADIQGQFASERAREKLRDRALRDTDRLVGRLLDDVDQRRDAVVVVAPTPPAPDVALTVAAVRAPGFGTGLLKSPTSGRTGFVHLVDVAPTVLDLLGIDTPDAMEGRPMESVSSDVAIGERIDDMADANTDALFADEQSGIAKGIVFAIGLVLAIATAALVDRVVRARAFLAFVALALVGFLAATYLAQPFHFAGNGGATAYWLFVVGVTIVLAVVDTVLGRRLGKPVDALLLALGTLVVIHLVNLIVGAPLELNTVFGYSATTHWRVGGISGFAFAQLAAAAILFAGLVARRIPGRTGIRIALSVLAATVVVVGAPMFGDDFAGFGVLAVASGLMSWMLLGRRLRTIATTLAILGLLVLAAFAALVRNERGSALTDARRAVVLNLPFFRHSILLGMVFVVGALVAYLWYAQPRTLRSVVSGSDRSDNAFVAPTMLAFAIVALCGFAMNVPAVSIAGMMAVVLEGAVVHLVARRS